MSRTTTVESLLGVLSFGPKSGYEMRQFMERSTGNFWSESFGQIYPALRSMLADGLVEMVDDGEDEGHPAKKVYRITSVGEERFREWLGVPLKPHKVRNELLLKVFFGDKGDPALLAEHVRAWRARYAADLVRYEGVLREMESVFAEEPGMPYWRMTLRYGMGEARMILAWCEETLEELERQRLESRE